MDRGAVDCIMSLFRALEVDIEAKYDMKVLGDHPGWPQIVGDAALTLRMLHMRRADWDH